jgi:hypothetical protein
MIRLTSTPVKRRQEQRAFGLDAVLACQSRAYRFDRYAFHFLFVTSLVHHLPKTLGRSGPVEGTFQHSNV